MADPGVEESDAGMRDVAVDSLALLAAMVKSYSLSKSLEVRANRKNPVQGFEVKLM